jgi:hypothetical protein
VSVEADAGSVCTWNGVESDCVGTGGSLFGAQVNVFSGGVDGLGGGGWTIVFSTDGLSLLSKCGLSPTGFYAGFTDWSPEVSSGTIEVRFSNVTVA